jgi:hypothetical protein
MMMFIIYFKQQMEFYLVTVTLQQDNKQIHISHKIAHHTKNKIAHKSTQAMEGILSQLIKFKKGKEK